MPWFGGSTLLDATVNQSLLKQRWHWRSLFCFTHRCTQRPRRVHAFDYGAGFLVRAFLSTMPLFFNHPWLERFFTRSFDSNYGGWCRAMVKHGFPIRFRNGWRAGHGTLVCLWANMAWYDSLVESGGFVGSALQPLSCPRHPTFPEN